MLKINHPYKHVKSGNEYIVTGTRKVKIDSEWRDCIDYFDEKLGLHFSREIEDFHLKFEIVEVEGRILYNELKSRGISTLDVNKKLNILGIQISSRSLQNHIDSDMKSCKDERILKIIKAMIDHHDEFFVKFKKLAA